MRGSSRQRGVGSKKSLVFAQRKIALLAVGDTKSNWWSQWAVNRGVRRDVALLQRRFSAAGYKGKKVNGCASTGSGKQPQRVSREVKLAMHRMSRVVSWTVAIVSIAGIIVFFWVGPMYEYAQRRARSAKIFPDLLRAAALSRIACKAYEQTGLLLTSRLALERSAFYPFTNSYEQGCTEGQHIDLTYVVGSRSFWLGLGWDEQGIRVKYRVEAPAIEPREQTRRLLNFYLSGVRNILTVVHDLRQDFAKQHQQAILVSRGTCKLFWKERSPLVAPRLTGDLPANRRELSKYVHWLSHEVVGSPLSDGWGMPVTLYMRGDYLYAQSAGEDRRMGTSDDIVVKKGIISR